ncbi:MAG: DUF4159 domain-containing protein [Alphaproteobacteria bacterium]|nr:DUF4159 domain-containing protein [Alphaproteobacteria bacterium]
MLNIGAFAFANAWMLTALAVLPVLWWLLRVTPPAPRIIRFPAIRLLLRLKQEEETPAHTPLWLLLLRLLLVTLLILGLAHPLLNPRAGFPEDGPLVIVLDNDWAAAVHWQDRQAAVDALIDQAERNERPVVLLTTARPATGEPLLASGLLRAADARIQAQAIQPLPWSADRSAARDALLKLGLERDANIVWLSNGLEGTAAGAGQGAESFAEALASLGTLRVFGGDLGELPRLLRVPVAERGAFKTTLMRSHGRGAETVSVTASAGDGRVLAQREVSFSAGDREATLVLDLPAELRNRVERLSIQNEASAGATVLLDERWRRRPVGLIAGESPERDQPLLSELYYVERALSPYSEVRRGSVSDLLARELAVVVHTDAAPVTEDQRRDLADWVERGGLLIRFAGPRLSASADSLLPVKLRRGDRSFGGAMSWTRPEQLAPFGADSPFFALAVTSDVLISRQVLAEPAADLAQRTWARLEDGTPLVTSAPRGQGLIVLVHTTANMDWSNLPISGLFVDMLRRLIDLSGGVVADAGDQVLPPIETMDGFGRLRSAPATASGIAESEIETARPAPQHPPGLYGNSTVRRAFNLSPSIERLAPLGSLPAGAILESYSQPGEIDLRPVFLSAALLLALIDLLIALALRGLLPAMNRSAGAAAGALVLLMVAHPANAEQAAQNGDAYAISSTTVTRLAYVVTGDDAIDEVSRAGLSGLGRVLFRRTAVELGDPIGVAVEADELAFFPLLYWPVSGEQQELSRTAAERLTEYLRRGGTVLFDTRDQQEFNPRILGIRKLLRGLTVPPLEPVPPEHVLTKAFYLLQRFPGRWAGGRVWVERRGRTVNDGVSSVIIGSNDWAGAWAVDRAGRHMFAVVPGGEAQREQAYRFGVNVVMYALTGNYKADQVHVPTILRRLGQ